jgi:cytochrome c556
VFDEKNNDGLDRGLLSLPQFHHRADVLELQEQTHSANPLSDGRYRISPGLPGCLLSSQSQEPVFLFRMLGMAAPMSGIIVDLMEKEPQNTMANFEKFKAQYQEVSKLVPEWTQEYSLDPVDGLGRALKTGNQDAVMKAFEQVNGVCLKCHLENMVRVQQKYHWGNFYAIKTKDPITQEGVDGIKLMQYLDSSLTGISVDLAEGQNENARKQLYAFKARFQTLKNVCEECHGANPRKYYVDESVQAMISGLEQTLSVPSPDSQKANSLVRGIGMESCFKCHLVHIPPALAQFPRTSLKNK